MGLHFPGVSMITIGPAARLFLVHLIPTEILDLMLNRAHIGQSSIVVSLQNTFEIQLRVQN